MNFGSFLTPRKDLMSLDPFRLSNRMERLLEDPLFRSMGEEWPRKAWAPPCDIFETEKELVMKFELPEVRKEDVEVKLEQNVLTLRGERKFEEKTDGENYHRIERHYGEFMRSFSVPLYVNAARINAEFKEGVLTITLPKNEEARPKQIDVKVN
ncbi:MAG TPA: Hsp20/alpha crystallin family protein [Pyrinomonadaceae bacterium]|nr:Hsp20/alpha crystallin family protein [Pyrinomonadaceae bacterium]